MFPYRSVILTLLQRNLPESLDDIDFCGLSRSDEIHLRCDKHLRRCLMKPLRTAFFLAKTNLSIRSSNEVAVPKSSGYSHPALTVLKVSRYSDTRRSC